MTSIVDMEDEGCKPQSPFERKITQWFKPLPRLEAGQKQITDFFVPARLIVRHRLTKMYNRFPAEIRSMILAELVDRKACLQMRIKGLELLLLDKTNLAIALCPFEDFKRLVSDLVRWVVQRKETTMFELFSWPKPDVDFESLYFDLFEDEDEGDGWEDIGVDVELILEEFRDELSALHLELALLFALSSICKISFEDSHLFHGRHWIATWFTRIESQKIGRAERYECEADSWRQDWK
ncbi:hypothetical protein FH972_021873 [Carpinus fangiana]|uniref:Uncharacterized protein n=1 Tax=Carpinus fangiana TaxID=176857 RepID=A0A5N6KR50_9ROSI|nr:hypothetical protein FH972_021873 [Carpinus fangiana]